MNLHLCNFSFQINKLNLWKQKIENTKDKHFVRVTCLHPIVKYLSLRHSSGSGYWCMANSVKGRQLQELKDSILVTVRGPMDGISGSHLCCSQCRKLGSHSRNGSLLFLLSNKKGGGKRGREEGREDGQHIGSKTGEQQSSAYNIFFTNGIQKFLLLPKCSMFKLKQHVH